MSTAELDKLSKKELIDKTMKFYHKSLAVEQELAQLKRMVFGSKSERHIPEPENQLTLFDLKKSI
jgi:hypothetical protein